MISLQWQDGVLSFDQAGLPAGALDHLLHVEETAQALLRRHFEEKIAAVAGVYGYWARPPWPTRELQDPSFRRN